jgi:hypothetical protein
MEFAICFEKKKITGLRATAAHFSENAQVYGVCRLDRTRLFFPVMPFMEGQIVRDGFSHVVKYVNPEDERKLKMINFVLLVFKNEKIITITCNSFQELQYYRKKVKSSAELQQTLTKIIMGDVDDYFAIWIRNDPKGYFFQSISDEMTEHPLSLKMELLELLNMIEKRS